MATKFQIGERVRYVPKGASVLWPRLRGVEGVVEVVGPYDDFCQLKFGPGQFDYILPNAEHVERVSA